MFYLWWNWPTHDDITTESIATAFQVDLEKNKIAMNLLKNIMKNLILILMKPDKKWQLFQKEPYLLIILFHCTRF